MKLMNFASFLLVNGGSYFKLVWPPYQWWQKIVEFRGAGAQSGNQIGEEGMISYTPRT